MIKKLRRRFICVNMTILTMVMLSVLAAVFVLMYRSEVKASEEIMDSIIASHHPQPDAEDPPPPDVPSALAPTAEYTAGEVVALYDPYAPAKTTTAVTDSFADEYDGVPPVWDEPYYLDDRYFDWFDEVAPPEEDWREDHGFRPPPWEEDPQMTAPPQETQTRPPFEEQTRPTEPTQTTIASTSPQTSSAAASSTKPAAATTTTRTALTTTTATAGTTTTTVTAEATTAETAGTTTVAYLRGSIYLKVDENKQIASISASDGNPHAMSDMSAAIQQVLDRGDSEGKIRLEDGEYRYRLVPKAGAREFDLVLLDRSIELSTLSRLLLIFLVVAAIGVLILFGISVALANWAVKPVEVAWDKQKQFVADASHELKTPLAVISANTDVILANPDGTVREQEKWLHYIKDETQRMSKLVSNLLFIAKSDAKQTATTLASIDLSELVSSVCLVFEPIAFENGKLLEARVQDGVQYLCDKDKMKQLLTILIDNAVIHSADHAQITVSLSQDAQEKIRIVVSNNADDIPKDKLERLFDRFYRLDESRAKRTGGSGLGLNIARTIAQFHGGTVVASSENGIVSFIVTL